MTTATQTLQELEDEVFYMLDEDVDWLLEQLDGPGENGVLLKGWQFDDEELEEFQPIRVRDFTAWGITQKPNGVLVSITWNPQTFEE